MSDNERDTRVPQRNSDADLYNWSGDCNGKGSNGSRGNGNDVYKYDGSGRPNGGTDNTAGGDDNVPANWHPDYSLSSKSAQEWFQQSQALRKQKLDLDQNGDHVVQHGDSLWTIAQRELHDNGKQGTNEEIKQEIARIAKLNESQYPSLTSKPDFIRDGWKLHIEQGGRQPDPGADSGPQCVPKSDSGSEVTPPGYNSKPRVIINNVYTDNAYFNQSSGGPGGNRPDQCFPNRGDDVYRYSGDRQGPTGGTDLYNYSGDQRTPNMNRNNGDNYAYSGDRNFQGPRYNDTPYNGTGNDGTSFYPGAGSAQDQLYRGGGRMIINNVNAENAYFDQRGGYEPSPGCRIMQRAPYQSGQDNYYNCNRDRARVIPVSANGDGNYDQYSQDQPQYPNGDGSTDYYTYSGNSRQTGDYYSDARSQQGVSIDTRSSTYRNPAGSNDGSDDQYAY